MAQGVSTIQTGRSAGAKALAKFVRQMPQPGAIDIDRRGLDDDQRRLAVAITRCGTQRYLTLGYLLDRLLSQRLVKLEPKMAGILLSGAAQLVFLSGSPDYAVVDESVSLARTMLRPKAGDMVNAVLRNLTRLIEAHAPETPWTFDAERLPAMPGSVIFHEPILPDPADLPAYLSVATSHPRVLVNDWLKQLGPEQTSSLCLHGLSTAPTYVFESDESYQSWTDTHEALTAYLEADPLRRVQDLTAAKPVQALAGYYAQSQTERQPESILDLCAGLGTKTRQLAAHFPQAQITATDTHADRRAELEHVAGLLDQVEVLGPQTAMSRMYDLIVLDVPCTNTGVLGRRPEARYRYSHKTLTTLAALQRHIVEQASTLIRPGGVICYATCSLQRDENDPQAKALSRHTAGRIVVQGWTLPHEPSQPYHDGGYYALVHRPTKMKTKR